MKELEVTSKERAEQKSGPPISSASPPLLLEGLIQSLT